MVRRVEIGGEPGRRIVGEPDRFLLMVEPDEPGKGAEGFLAGEERVRRHVHEQRRAREMPFGRAADLALRQNARSALDRIGAVAFDLRYRLGVDEGALVGASRQPVSGVEETDLAGERRREAVVDTVLDQEAVGADACLSAVAKLGGDRPGNGARRCRRRQTR